MENGLQKQHVAGIILGGALLASALFLGTGTLPAGAQTACVVPPSGMVSWWPGDGNANDIQGTNHATLQNGATFTTGNVNQAFSLDGVDDHITVPHSASWEFGVNDFTIDFWLYKVSNVHGYIARDATTLFSPWIIGSNDLVYMTSTGSSWDIVSGASMGAIPVNTWTHIAVVRSGSTFRAYNSGNVASTWTSSAALALNSNPLSIGKVQNQTNFAGRIDELEIFNRALTQTEIQSIVNAANAGKCKPSTPPPSPGCGNGVIETGEQCDDGNIANGDGCSSACQLEACPAPTNSFTNALSHAEFTDIPGLAYGPNAAGQNVLWVGSYCGLGPCSWPGETIQELNPITGATITQHPSLGWRETGPAGIAYDSMSVGGPYLWVADYNGALDLGIGVYKVRISDYTVVSSFGVYAFCGRPLGGIAFDGTNLWLSCPEASSVKKLTQGGTLITSYPGIVAGGLEYFNNRLFTINSGTISVRDMNFNVVGTYAFPDSPGDTPGDLSTIDPATGNAFWGARGLANFRKLHLVDTCQAQDTTPPDTTITSQPTSPTSNTSATFSFTSNEAGSTFECQRDGSAFTACTSPVSFSGLGNGMHTFAVRAKDAAGNLDATPASFAWVVDTVEPVATITAGPANPAFEATVTFTFTANEQASFECQLDGSAFAVCASPKTYAVADGSHIFAVRAIDQVGNIGAPASFSWTVNTSPDRDADGIVNQIDTLPDTSSNNFDDRPLGGTTFGTISSRGGLTVLVEKPVASAVVRVSASGVGTTAVINACAENFKVLLTAGDVADIICGASITADAITTIDDVVVRSATKIGRSARMRLLQSQRGTMADPPLEVTMTAASTNLSAMTFEVVDDGSETLLAVGILDKTESLKVDFTLAEAVNYQVVSGTIDMTIDGTAVQLAPDQTLADQCPGVSGNLANTGCPVGDKNIVTLHNVYLGGGTTSKAPLADARVRVFDRNNPNFQTVAGSKNPDGSLYGVIYEADAGRVGACTTVSDGTCFAGERVTGDYLVVVKFADSATGKTVYVGRPKSPSDFVDTNGDGAPDLATKDFQIMKVYKKGVFQEYRGGDKTVVTGSMLEMIVPAGGVWEGTRSLYPFVFNSDSDWTVDICARVPQGYSLVGAYNENGDLIASTQCVQTAVANQTRVIAFEVKEVASPEPSFAGTLKVAHKGKVTPVEVRVSDIRKVSFEAKLKEARAKVGVKETGASRAGRGDKEARLMKVGASLWSIVRDVFGLKGRDAEIVAIGKKVAQLNAIRVPEWGITEGAYDAVALPWGFVLDLGEEDFRLAP